MQSSCFTIRTVEIIDLVLWLFLAFAIVWNYGEVPTVAIVQLQNAELRAKIEILERNVNALSHERAYVAYELAGDRLRHKEFKIAYYHELDQIRQAYKELKEQHQSLLTATTVAITNSDVILALRSQTSLLSEKLFDLDRVQSLLETRSSHFAHQFKSATSTIASLSEDKAKGAERITWLERNLEEANNRTEEMVKKYMMSILKYEGEEKNEVDKEKEEEGNVKVVNGG